MLVDKVNIVVKAGNGGGGLISFRKEKFQPFGGPDGGDGGKGGDVHIASDRDMNDLSTFKHKKHYKAQDGQAGGSNKMQGADARDLLIKVPVGTTVYVKKDGEELLLGDLYMEHQRIKVASGGKGGKGNVHFATSTRKAPRMSQPGVEGPQVEIVLQLRLPVDVAVIGLPNSGKSSLISAVSGARPLIAEFPFSTTEPVLGAVDRNLRRYTWAELPAIIKGSHKGKGLGNHHLAHAERARLIILLLDISSENIEDDLNTLLAELELFRPDLIHKMSVIVLDKTNLVDTTMAEQVRGKLASYGKPVYTISCHDKTGLEELIGEVHKLVEEVASITQEVTQPEIIFRPEPVDRRRQP
jgi:GTP-binding protein